MEWRHAVSKVGRATGMKVSTNDSYTSDNAAEFMRLEIAKTRRGADETNGLSNS